MSADQDDRIVPRVERLHSSFRNDGVVLEIDGQSLFPFGDPGVDDKLESDQVVRLDQEVGPAGTKGRHRRAFGDLAVARISHAMTIDGKAGLIRIPHGLDDLGVLFRVDKRRVGEPRLLQRGDHDFQRFPGGPARGECLADDFPGV